MPGRVLVVDDEEPIRILIQRLLSKHGFSVETAPDGAAAIDKIAHEDFDAVVLDLMMPRIDGFAVVKYLSEHRPEVLANVIVVTAFGPNAIEKVCPPIVRVVEKPFDLNALVAEATACVDDQSDAAS